MINFRSLTAEDLAALRLASGAKWLMLGCRNNEAVCRFDTDEIAGDIADALSEEQNSLIESGLLRDSVNKPDKNAVKAELLRDYPACRVFMDGSEGIYGIGRIEAASDRYFWVVLDYYIEKPFSDFWTRDGFVTRTAAEEILDCIEPFDGVHVYTDFTSESLADMDNRLADRLAPQHFRVEGAVTGVHGRRCVIAGEDMRVVFHADPGQSLSEGDCVVVEGRLARMRTRISEEEDGKESRTLEIRLADCSVTPCGEAADETI
ncbi:MAG: hypothetical protein IK083_09130 [Abditibacteriota bacterium]|nr:hypothetical protein [Abditibacteriota bacterium]